MIKCTKCGTINEDDSLYCEECGEKLEHYVTCPNCGSQIKSGKKFCSKCGTGINSPGVSIGDKNVIGGDVIGFKEENKFYGNTTIVKNEDETKKSWFVLFADVESRHMRGLTVPNAVDLSVQVAMMKKHAYVLTV